MTELESICRDRITRKVAYGGSPFGMVWVVRAVD